jgi:hypothetical protein
MNRTAILLLVMTSVVWSAWARAAEQKPVLMVLTSHARLGDTGKPTGFFLGEVTHPLEVFEKAGLTVELVSIKGG